MLFSKLPTILILLACFLYSSCSNCPESFPHTKLEQEKVPIILPYKEGQKVSFLFNSKDTINYVCQKMYEDEIFKGGGGDNCLFGEHLQRYSQRLFANDSTYIDLKFNANYNLNPDVEFINQIDSKSGGEIKFYNSTLVETYYKSYISINVLNQNYDSVKLCTNYYPRSEHEFYFKPKFGLIKMNINLTRQDTSYFATYELIK